MDLNEIKKTIQDFFQENTVTIVGSGLSIAENIPGMKQLAEELQNKIPRILTEEHDRTIWSNISADLSREIGLEQALHNTKPSSNIEENIRKITAQYIGNAEKQILDDLIHNNRQLRFSEYIQHFNIRNNGLFVITTNYDRLIEYACEFCDIRVDNLFVGKNFAYFEPEQSKYMFCKNVARRASGFSVEYAPKVTVLKPHGCLSWHLINGTPYSIPHASLEDSLIITPGINKYKEGYNEPFDTHRAKANTAIDSAQRYIIIGYGFGDDHLETHLVRQLKAGKSALILTYSLSKKAEDLIKSCKNITAICCDNKNNSLVINQSEKYLVPNIKLWDLQDMLKEVF